MTNLAFLGLGAMGSRMVKKLLGSGYDVTVWNRSPEQAEALSAYNNVKIAESPRAAASAASVVFSMVRDDDASENVWLNPDTGALASMQRGTIAVECSTLTPDWVRTLHRHAAEQGVELLDAPLAGSRPQAEAGQLIFFTGGEATTLQRVEPLLELMGSKVHHAGATGSGATVKLMVNALFGTQLALLAEMIGFARKTGINPEKAVEIIASTPVCSPAAKGAASAMLAGQWNPAFPIELVAKDFELIKTSAANSGTEIPLALATGAIYQDAVHEGFGQDNITGVVQRYLAK